MRSLTLGSIAVALAVTVLGAPAALAETTVKPSTSACNANPADYACLKVSTARQVAGAPVSFTGSLRPEAMRPLKSWTRGENTVCLIRFEPKPARNGWWSQTLDHACTKVNGDGTFSMTVALGKLGLHYYGVEMGPCRASEDECGNADPGLLGVANKQDRVVAVRTVAR